MAAKMSVNRGGPVDWPLETQAGNHPGGRQIEVSLDQGQDFRISKAPAAKGFHPQRERGRLSDDVGCSQFAPAGQTGGDYGFGRLPEGVGGTPVHLGGVFAGKTPTAMTSQAAISVHHGFSAGRPGIAMGPTDDKPAGGIDEEPAALIQKRGGDSRADHFPGQVCPEGGHIHLGGMLG